MPPPPVPAPASDTFSNGGAPGTFTATAFTSCGGAASFTHTVSDSQPRASQPSPALVSARDAVSRLVVQWDDAAADRIAADNLFLDQSKPRRRADLDALRVKYGACTPPSAFDSVENALRGQWTMSCERGKLQVSITLAPTMPPRVQYLSVRPAPELDAGPARTGVCPP